MLDSKVGKPLTPKWKDSMKAASNSDDKGGKLNVYLPAGYLKKLDQLLNILAKEGVDMSDKNRKDVLSKSKLIQYLVKEELKRHGINEE